MVDYSFSLYTLEYFLMILVRIATFIFVAPFFSMNMVPNRVKIGFSFVTALLVYQLVLPKNPMEYSGIFDYTVIVLKEGITGLLIGFMANICNSIVLLSGKIIDMDIGLAMAQVFDPVSNTTSGLTGNIYNYFLMLLLIVTDMHHFILRSLIDTYTVIPPGGAVFHWDNMLLTMLKFIADMMIIGFQIVLPVFACIMILNCVLGILAKVSPQMNMFSVGIELKLLVGLAVMFLCVSLMPGVANFIFEEMKRMMVSITRSMY